MSAEGIAVYGNITAEEVTEALRKAYPDRRFSSTDDVVTKVTVQKLTKGELLVSKLVPSETEKMLHSEVSKKEKERKEAEESASKALLSIQTFHKQQQALFDEFVLLRQRYDEQKTSTVNILWTHCSKFHPDLRMIPDQEDPKTFVETDEQIGTLTVGDPLGEGQFATVKNCYMPGDPKEYALKIINKDRITSFTALMRVSTEIDNLKLLKNPYIVSVTQVIHTESKLYIITEKGGKDLFEFFDEHPDGVPEEWAKQIIACILKGVMFCHDQGICHRDLKPENILVSFDAKAGKCIDLKLCDFGLSTKFKAKTTLTDFCGSPGFFAPEMITHGSYHGDKADVWSTGCILLELVAGHEKFCDVWMTAYDYEVLQDKERFTDTIHDTVEQLPGLLNFSPGLNEFILRFLELSQSKRPTTAQLCSHPWVKDLVEVELSQRTQKMEILSTKSSMRSEFADSPTQSLKNMLSASNIEESETETIEERAAFVEMIFSNLSERERKHMRDYIIHHKNDGPDKHHAQMHLPPIVPSTPSIGNAKKILRKGNEIANQNYHMPNNGHNLNNEFHSPQAKFSPAEAIAPFSPQGSHKQGNASRSNSISPLPGVSEMEEFNASSSEKMYHTPQHHQAKPHSILKGSHSAGSSGSSGRAEAKQLLFASQSEREFPDATTLSSSSY